MRTLVHLETRLIGLGFIGFLRCMKRRDIVDQVEGDGGVKEIFPLELVSSAGPAYLFTNASQPRWYNGDGIMEMV